MCALVLGSISIWIPKAQRNSYLATRIRGAQSRDLTNYCGLRGLSLGASILRLASHGTLRERATRFLHLTVGWCAGSPDSKSVSWILLFEPRSGRQNPTPNVRSPWISWRQSGGMSPNADVLFRVLGF
jgi:hypothetical protein